MYLDHDGGKLFVEVVENKKTTPLFLLPGGPGLDHLAYKINQPDFEKNFTVVYYDPRGCGKSTGFAINSFTLDKNIDDIEFIRKSLNLNEIMVLGSSYGSMVAMGYAIRYPQHLSKLVLVTGAPNLSFWELAKENLLKRGNPEQIELCNKFLFPGLFPSQDEVDNFFKVVRSLYSDRVLANPELAKIISPLIKCSIDPLNAAFKNKLWGFDFVPHLPKIKCPTKVLGGRHDWINDPKMAQIIHENIKNSELVYFNTGHSIAFDAYPEYLKVCNEFLGN